MALYTASYWTDSGKEQPRCEIGVYRMDGDIQAKTDVDFDSAYLPQVLADNLLTGFRCGKPLLGTRTVRHAKVTTIAGDVLLITCPFRGGTSDFFEFFDDLRSNPKILNVELIGEHVNAVYTRANVGLGIREV